MNPVQAIAGYLGRGLKGFALRAAGQLEGSWHRLDIGGVGTGGSLAGVRINERSVLSLAAAWACINRISTDIAFLPLVVMQRVEVKGGSRRRVATEHPAYDLLATSPDGHRTTMRFRQSQMGYTLGWGNGISVIERNGAGWPTRFTLQPGGSVTPYVRQTDKGISYRLGNGQTVRSENVLHFAGLGPDGLSGYSVVKFHREGLGTAMAQGLYGGAFFGNGSRAGGYLKTPKKLSVEAAKRLREQFERVHRGVENAHRIAVLEEGTEFQGATINPVDAQYLEQRRFSIFEICRMYGVPPHKIFEYSQLGVAASGIDAANIDYITTTILPWCVQLEQEYDLKLFTAEERKQGYYVKHNVAALLRGDPKARAEFYATALQNGWLSRDEIRAIEDLDPIGDAGGGSKYTAQVNLTTLDKIGQAQLPKKLRSFKARRRRSLPGPSGPEPEPDAEHVFEFEDDDEVYRFRGSRSGLHEALRSLVDEDGQADDDEPLSSDETENDPSK